MFIYTIHDIIGLVMLLLFAVGYIIYLVSNAITSMRISKKQEKCEHAELREDWNGKRICKNCEKNLGFERHF